MPIGICSHRGVKFALPLFLIMAFVLNACTTLSNRRDLYSPAHRNGPYTDKLAQRQMEITVTTPDARPTPH